MIKNGFALGGQDRAVSNYDGANSTGAERN